MKSSIVESLRKIENQTFNEKDEYHDLIGVYLSESIDKNVDDSKLEEMIQNNDLDGVIKYLEETWDMYPEDEDLDDSVPVSTPWECEDEDDYCDDDYVDECMDAIEDDTVEECIDINESVLPQSKLDTINSVTKNWKSFPDSWDDNKKDDEIQKQYDSIYKNDIDKFRIERFGFTW